MITMTAEQATQVVIFLLLAGGWLVLLTVTYGLVRVAAWVLGFRLRDGDRW